MRIAIDARLNAYRRGGIPQYTRFLLTSMAEIAREDQFISLQHRDMLRPLAVAQNVLRRTIYTPPHHRFEQWSLPVEVTFARPHVFHAPDFIAPLRRTFPAVATIHDLAFMHYPDILDDAARAYYSRVKASSHRADSIIAVSEATRQDIVQFLDLPPEQIHVIYEAAAPIFRPMDLRTSEARVLNGIPIAAGSFMLFVSTLEPRKNIPTLLRALRICLDRQPSRSYFLVIAGGRGWRDDGIFTWYVICGSPIMCSLLETWGSMISVGSTMRANFISILRSMRALDCHYSKRWHVVPHVSPQQPQACPKLVGMRSFTFHHLMLKCGLIPLKHCGTI